jgi:hypothetical protein
MRIREEQTDQKKITGPTKKRHPALPVAYYSF